MKIAPISDVLALAAGVVVGAAGGIGLALGFTSDGGSAVAWGAVGAVTTGLGALGSACAAGVAFVLARRAWSTEDRIEKTRSVAVVAVIGPPVFNLMCDLRMATMSGARDDAAQRLRTLHSPPIDLLAQWIQALQPETAAVVAKAFAGAQALREMAVDRGDATGLTAAVVDQALQRDAESLRALLSPVADKMWAELHGDLGRPWVPVIPQLIANAPGTGTGAARSVDEGADEPEN